MSKRDFARTERLGAELQRVLATVLTLNVKDPRLANITIQEVRVTRDLAHAKVYFTCFNAQTREENEAQAELLNTQLASYLRHLLSDQVSWRTVPQLHFVYDESIAYGQHLTALIDQAVKADQAKDAEESEDNSASPANKDGETQ